MNGKSWGCELECSASTFVAIIVAFLFGIVIGFVLSGLAA